MTQPATPADSTREQIMRSAAHLFSRRSYSEVSLDDILGDAQLTKTAMYRHFESKHALAVALIERRVMEAAKLLGKLTTTPLSGIETLIDTTYRLAAQDTGDDIARAGYLLLESEGRIEGLRMMLSDAYAQQLAPVVERAIAEGDIVDRHPPVAVAHLLVTIYTGLLAIHDLDDQPRFVNAVEQAWFFALHSFANPERIEYLEAFVRRRTAVAQSRIGSAK